MGWGLGLSELARPWGRLGVAGRLGLWRRLVGLGRGRMTVGAIGGSETGQEVASAGGLGSDAELQRDPSPLW